MRRTLSRLHEMRSHAYVAHSRGSPRGCEERSTSRQGGSDEAAVAADGTLNGKVDSSASMSALRQAGPTYSSNSQRDGPTRSKAWTCTAPRASSATTRGHATSASQASAGGVVGTATRCCTLRLLPRADLATLRSCDALATSANAGLVGNANPNFWRFSGRRNADGALHRAAGPALLAACAEIAAIDSRQTRCRVAEAVVTPGAFGSLHAGLIVHAVAPDGAYAVGLQQWWGRRQWSGANHSSGSAVHLEEAPPHGEAAEQLAQTYAAVLEAAEAHGVRSVGIPAIGCGVLGFAPDLAASIAFGAVAAHMASRGGGSGIERLDVALHSDAVFDAWQTRARELLGPPRSEGPDAAVYDVESRA